MAQEVLCWPKTAGDQNILSVLQWNRAVIAKLLWNLCKKKGYVIGAMNAQLSHKRQTSVGGTDTSTIMHNIGDTQSKGYFY